MSLENNNPSQKIQQDNPHLPFMLSHEAEKRDYLFSTAYSRIWHQLYRSTNGTPYSFVLGRHSHGPSLLQTDSDDSTGAYEEASTKLSQWRLEAGICTLSPELDAHPNTSTTIHLLKHFSRAQSRRNLAKTTRYLLTDLHFEQPKTGISRTFPTEHIRDSYQAPLEPPASSSSS